MAKLLLSDGDIEITDKIVENFKLIKMIMEDIPEQDIPCRNMNMEITSELVHFAEHGNLKTNDPDKLVQIALASNFYDYDECMDYACKEIAEFLKGKSPEFIRRFLAL